MTDHDKERDHVSLEVLRGFNQVDTKGNTKCFSSSDFWYYTSLYTASDILESREFWVSSLFGMNDKAEAERHQEVAKRIHALCFCNSRSEKIPMWYLYAGLSGRGVSIGMTPNTMLNFINGIDQIKIKDSDRILKKDIDYEIQIGWVFYVDGKTRFYYKGNWYSLDDCEAELFKGKNYFIKDYPWEYEKEFRIVFINNTDVEYEKLRVPIPKEVYFKLKIRLAPEIKKEEEWELLSGRKGFQEYFLTKCLHSNLGINMSLYKRNIKDLQEHWEEIFEEGKDYINFEKLNSLVHNYL